MFSTHLELLAKEIDSREKLRKKRDVDTLRRQHVETLRMRLMHSYPKDVVEIPCEPTEISTNKFISGMCKFLEYANIPYTEKQKHGLFYAEDYVKYFAKNEVCTNIFGLTHPTFWDISARYNLFRAKEGHLPSQVLQAFFNGPTFAECGTVLQACVYKAIEEMVGTHQFDQLFGSALTKFLITPILYNKIQSASEQPDNKLEFRTANGNPLYFLFNNSETKNEHDINIGDILHIKGVDKYPSKHLVGCGQGWNVICVGKNSDNENLYLGFGPETFRKPLTYKEIQSVLIKFYNDSQSNETKQRINKYITRSDLSEIAFFNQSVATQARALANDKVDETYTIGGIKRVIRFNLEKLEHFMHQEMNSWHTNQLENIENESEIELTKNTENSVKQITTFSVETRGKTFNDYQVQTAAQYKMLSVAKKFALAVCNDKNSLKGLVMTGMPGIGKTHLSIAVASYAAQHGLKVVFVDDQTISDLYQKISVQQHGPASDSEMKLIFDNWLKDADLIILDDINSEYGIGAQFLKQAINYAMEHNAAIMISGNRPIHCIQAYLPDYIGYTDKRRNNFLIFQDIKGVSYRKNWWSTSEIHSSTGALTSNHDVIEILANLSTNQAAGIMLEEKETDLTKISRLYLELSPDKNIKIRILQKPYQHNRVFDFYVHDFDQHDVFVMKANDISESEQMLHLISHVHDLGKKIIVVTDNESELKKFIDKSLTYSSLEKYQQRLNDRARNILLTPSDWHEVKPSVLPKGSDESISISDYKVTIGPPKLPSKLTSKLTDNSSFYIDKSDFLDLDLSTYLTPHSKPYKLRTHFSDVHDAPWFELQFYNLYQIKSPLETSLISISSEKSCYSSNTSSPCVQTHQSHNHGLTILLKRNMMLFKHSNDSYVEKIRHKHLLIQQEYDKRFGLISYKK